MRDRERTARERLLSHLEVARACFREAEIVRHWRTVEVFRKMGQQYLDKAKRLDPNILGSAPARTRVTWRLDSSATERPDLRIDRAAT